MGMFSKFVSSFFDAFAPMNLSEEPSKTHSASSGVELLQRGEEGAGSDECGRWRSGKPELCSFCTNEAVANGVCYECQIADE